MGRSPRTRTCRWSPMRPSRPLRRASTKAARNGSSHGQAQLPVLSGMVRCCSRPRAALDAGQGAQGPPLLRLRLRGRLRRRRGARGPRRPEVHLGPRGRLVRLVLRFFEQRIFGPMRLERLEKQLRAQARSERRNGKLAGTRIRKQIAESTARSRPRSGAGEGDRAASGRRANRRASRRQGGARGGARGDRRRARGDRRRGAGRAARPGPRPERGASEASPEVQRQVFEAFDLQIAYDKVGRRIEISATVSEAVADAFENAKALQKEGSAVVVRDIAGARFVSRYHPRIVEPMRLAS